METATMPIPPGGSSYAGAGDQVTPRRYLELSLTLALSEFKVRYFDSVLGYLWTLLRPLMLFGILYFVFTRVVKFGDDVRHYPVYLLMSIVLFTYFSESTTGSVSSLVEAESLIRKIRFPLSVIPVSITITALLNLVLNLIVVFGFVFATGIDVRVQWLEVPVLIGLLVVTSLGISMGLAALYVHFRDVKHIWAVMTQLVFYASPIIYPLEFLPGKLDKILMTVNPLVPVIQQMRYAVIDPGARSAAGVMGGVAQSLVPFAFMTVLFLAGFWVFQRAAPDVAENL
jgi:ABC-2 type transport system permease protein